MHAAEPAGAHESDPHRPARRQRAADRRRADGALNERRREVARAHLACVGGEARQLVRRQAHTQHAVEDADRGGNPARLSNAPLALETDLDAFTRWEAVRDEGRLERDHGSSLCERLVDLVGDLEQILHGIEPSFATHLAAAASAGSGPPTR